MSEARLTVGDYASPGRGGVQNPCVMGCAHLFLGSLFVLGEGNGGTESGRVESRLAVSAVLADFRSSTIAEPRQRLQEALEHAGEVLHDRSRSGPAFSEAWATCVAILVRRGRLFGVRAGGLDVYLIRDGELRPLFGGAVRPPSDPEAADAASDLEIAPPDHLEHALGRSGEPKVTVLEDDIDLRNGDRLVIGNSALFASVQPQEILRIGSSLVPAVAARRLVEAVERSGSTRPVSVQVVQIGEATVMDDIGPQARKQSRVPVAPVRQKPSPSHVIAKTSKGAGGPRHHDIPADDAGSRLPRWGAIVILLALVAGAAVVGRGLFGGKGHKPTPPPAATSETARPEIVAPATAPASFWHRVEDTVDEETGALDPALVQRWLAEPGEARRRLREARAVIEALAGPAPSLAAGNAPALDPPDETGGSDGVPGYEEPDGTDPEPAGGSDPLPDSTGEPGAESTDPKPTSGVEPKPPDVRPPPTHSPGPGPELRAWDPGVLPPAIRGYERLFKHPDPKRAARLLRRYIHRRHDRVAKVLASIDIYLARAPKGRSLAVLDHMRAVRPKPGPRTAKWARKAAAKLRAELGTP